MVKLELCWYDEETEDISIGGDLDVTLCQMHPAERFVGDGSDMVAIKREICRYGRIFAGGPQMLLAISAALEEIDEPGNGGFLSPETIQRLRDAKVFAENGEGAA